MNLEDKSTGVWFGTVNPLEKIFPDGGSGGALLSGSALANETYGILTAGSF